MGGGVFGGLGSGLVEWEDDGCEVTEPDSSRDALGRGDARDQPISLDIHNPIRRAFRSRETRTTCRAGLGWQGTSGW